MCTAQCITNMLVNVYAAVPCTACMQILQTVDQWVAEATAAQSSVKAKGQYGGHYNDDTGYSYGYPAREAALNITTIAAEIRATYATLM
jgi:hypothetical protein